MSAAEALAAALPANAVAVRPRRRDRCVEVSASSNLLPLLFPHEAVVRRRGRTYRYTRYAFANRSDDIKAILCDRLDQLGIRWTRPNEKDIAIARKADVARMDAFVGPKR